MEMPKHVGVPFAYDDNWIGGSYYVLNLIHALNQLPDQDKPVISIICPDKSQFKLVKNETGYSKLRHYSSVLKEYKPSMLVKIINKVWRSFFKRNFVERPKLNHDFDFMYPRYINDFKLKKMKKVVWMADLQEEFLPEFFSNEEIQNRRSNREYLSKNFDLIVFSSEQSKKDFIRCNPDYSATLEVLPFAVTHPDYNVLNISELHNTYQVPVNYYMVSNQFWAHKNHRVVIEALELVIKENPSAHVVFSGKEDDYRNEGYTQSIKKMVEDLGLNSNCSFLGFIPRNHQLKLMSASIAVIQPSLFEGWSTVVEDVKSIGGYLIVSDIGIHREQLAGNNNHDFFNPYSPKELSRLMLNKDKSVLDRNQQADYQYRVEEFGQAFKHLIDTYS